MSNKISVSIVGASGYSGGELLRLLLEHPNVELKQATSERNAGSFVHFTHPNLRGRLKMQFVSANELEECDLLFLCLPHGSATEKIDHYARLAPKLVDLSADFRLRNADDYVRWYGIAHTNPVWLQKFVYGLPEFHRDEIKQASYVSGVGCNATATNLAIYPLFAAGVVDTLRGVICEVKVGSSEAGNKSSDASHHAERAGVMRSFSPTGHRHTAEILQAVRKTGQETTVHLSATAIDNVRGILATAHLFAKPGIGDKELWKAYRQTYRNEPFVRIVKESTGIYRYPEPKILSGSNYADVGFEFDPETGRIVAMCAIDNLMKGAAGTAVQCMNLMMGYPETTALTFVGLHPI